MQAANFADTTIYVGEELHPQHGLINVMAYQNRAVTFGGPNAMLLHLDAATPMSQRNFIDTTSFPSILDDMVRALRPSSRAGASLTISKAPQDVLVFDVGVYTVVLSSNAASIPGALDRVPKHKRPSVNPPLFDFYAQAFPGWSVALCCFNNSEVRRSGPMLMWYNPMDKHTLRLPALDCHTGNVPALDSQVAVDHWVIASSYRMRKGKPVRYQGNIPPDVMEFLPDQVVGKYCSGDMRNGDFEISVDNVLMGRMDRMSRTPPPFSSSSLSYSR